MEFLERISSREGGVYDGETRYLLLRVDTLEGLLARLGPGAQAETLAAFAETVHEHGAKSIANYVRQSGADNAALLALIERTAPQLGWGQWRLALDAAAPALELEVAASPFTGLAPAARGPRCTPLAGMLRALAEQCFGRACRASELECEGLGAARCRFRAAPAGA